MQQVDHFLLEGFGPQLRVFDFDLVDHVDAVVEVHRFVAQDVLELLGGAGHHVAAAKRQHLDKADVEEDPLHEDVEADEVAQQALIGGGGAGVEIGVAEFLGELQFKGGLVMHRGDLAVHVEDFGLVHAQRFNDVLIGVGVQGLFKGLTQQVLPAFGIGDVAVDGQDQIIGDEGVGGREKAQVALDDGAFVVAEAIRFPQRHVGAHIDFLRHPMIGAGVQVFFPRPIVFEGDQLIEVSLAVDDLFIIDANPGGVAL